MTRNNSPAIGMYYNHKYANIIYKLTDSYNNMRNKHIFVFKSVKVITPRMYLHLNEIKERLEPMDQDIARLLYEK